MSAALPSRWVLPREVPSGDGRGPEFAALFLAGVLILLIAVETLR